MLHQVIETLNARVALRNRYDNYIGGKWVPPVDGQYFDNISPITGRTICQIARSQAADIACARRRPQSEGCLGQCRPGQARRNP